MSWFGGEVDSDGDPIYSETYSLEYSPSNKASCRRCHSKIDLKAIRVNIKATTGMDHHGEFWEYPGSHYEHLGCWTPQQPMRADAIMGYIKLKPDDQVLASAHIDQSSAGGGLQPLARAKAPARVRTVIGGAAATYITSTGSGAALPLQASDEEGEEAAPAKTKGGKKAAAKKPAAKKAAARGKKRGAEDDDDAGAGDATKASTSKKARRG